MFVLLLNESTVVAGWPDYGLNSLTRVLTDQQNRPLSFFLYSFMLRSSDFRVPVGIMKQHSFCNYRALWLVKIYPLQKMCESISERWASVFFHWPQVSACDVGVYILLSMTTARAFGDCRSRFSDIVGRPYEKIYLLDAHDGLLRSTRYSLLLFDVLLIFANLFHIAEFIENWLRLPSLHSSLLGMTSAESALLVAPMSYPNESTHCQAWGHHMLPSSSLVLWPCWYTAAFVYGSVLLSSSVLRGHISCWYVQCGGTGQCCHHDFCIMVVCGWNIALESLVF